MWAMVAMFWACGAVGSAAALQADGREFDSPQVHLHAQVGAAAAAPDADVAQVVERLPEEQGVPRPTRGVGTASAVRAFARSSRASPTGRNESRGYYRVEAGGRVVEVVQAAACKAADAGSSPAASSEPEGFEGCCGAMVQRYEHPVVAREAGVQLPLAPLPQAAESDTCALGRHPYAGVAQLVERRLAKAEVAGPNPVSRSSRGAGRGIHARHGWAGVAQLVERRPSKSEAAGSTPVPCSTRASRSVSSIVVI
jgi:hypothetical protein